MGAKLDGVGVAIGFVQLLCVKVEQNVCTQSRLRCASCPDRVRLRYGRLDGVKLKGMRSRSIHIRRIEGLTGRVRRTDARANHQPLKHSCRVSLLTCQCQQ